MVKYLTPPTTMYLFISFMISLGVPTIATLEFFFHILLRPKVFSSPLYFLTLLFRYHPDQEAL